MGARHLLKRSLRKLNPHHPANLPDDLHIRLMAFQKSIDTKTIAAIKRPRGYESKIEILIPCYNHGQYLEECFSSILNQTRKLPITVTFINDTSTDNTLEIMQRIKESSTADWLTIKIIDNKKNLNQWASINKAVKESQNELFIELDADDLLTPDCLELITYTYKKHPNIFLLGSASIWFEDGKPRPKHKLKKHSSLKLNVFGPKEAKKFKMPNDLSMSHSSSSFFRCTWKAVGGYRPPETRAFAQYDRDFQMRVCTILPVGTYLDYQTMFYRINSSQKRGTS